MPLQKTRLPSGQFVLLRHEDGNLFGECCCDLTSCNGCCCDSRVPLWFQPPVTVEITRASISRDITDESAYSCLAGSWVLPILSTAGTSLNGTCIWQNVFTAGVEGNAAVVRMRVTISMKLDRDLTTVVDKSCARLEIEFLSCFDCLGEPMQAPPTIIIDMSNRTCDVPVDVAASLNVGGCACDPAAEQDQLVPLVLATGEPGYEGACWANPEFSELTGIVRVRDPRIENDPPPDLESGADLAALEDDFIFDWSSDPCVWTYSATNPTPARFSNFAGADSPRDPTERLCDNSVDVLRPYPLDSVTVPVGYTLVAGGDETSVVMACNGSLNPEDGRITVGTILDEFAGEYPLTVQVEWLPPSMNSCYEQLGYEIVSGCPEDPGEYGACTQCVESDCGEPVAAGGPVGEIFDYAMPFVQRSPTSVSPLTLPADSTCEEPIAYGGSDCACPDPTEVGPFDYCGCAVFYSIIPTTLYSSDDAPIGARYEVQYTYFDVVYSMVYTKILGGTYGIWQADWDVSLDLRACVCAERCADFVTELRDNFKLTNNAPTGRVPGETLAPAGVSVELPPDAEDMTPVAVRFEVYAWYAPLANDPCCLCDSLTGGTATNPAANGEEVCSNWRCEFKPPPGSCEPVCSAAKVNPDIQVWRQCCDVFIRSLTVVDEQWVGFFDVFEEECKCETYETVTTTYDFDCNDGTYGVSSFTCEGAPGCDERPDPCLGGVPPATAGNLLFGSCTHEVLSGISCASNYIPGFGCSEPDACFEANGVMSGVDPLTAPSQTYGCNPRTLNGFTTDVIFETGVPEPCVDPEQLLFQEEICRRPPDMIKRRRQITIVWGDPNDKTCCTEQRVSSTVCIDSITASGGGPCIEGNCLSISGSPTIEVITSAASYAEALALAIALQSTQVLVFFRGGCGNTACALGGIQVNELCNIPNGNTGRYGVRYAISANLANYGICCNAGYCVTLLGYQLCDPPDGADGEMVQFYMETVSLSIGEVSGCDEESGDAVGGGGDSFGSLVLTGLDGLVTLLL